VFIPWFPLGAGKAAQQAVQRVADAHGAKPMQVALAWLLQRSPLMLPIPGTSSVEHLEENMLAGSLRLSEEEFAELEEVPELAFSR
jgi:aryl-alcohol dehydrogenase-like predicted oxidoreductase